MSAGIVSKSIPARARSSRLRGDPLARTRRFAAASADEWGCDMYGGVPIQGNSVKGKGKDEGGGGGSIGPAMSARTRSPIWEMG